MPRHKKYIVRLSDEDIATIKSTLKKKDTPEIICNRCRILLDLDENHPPVSTQVGCAKAHGISPTTVTSVARMFCAGGMDEVLTINRNINSNNGRRKVDGRIEAKIITLACGPAPDGHSRWTLRLLEDKLKVELDEPISRESIRRALKKTNFDLTNPITGASRPRQMPNS